MLKPNNFRGDRIFIGSPKKFMQGKWYTTPGESIEWEPVDEGDDLEGEQTFANWPTGYETFTLWNSTDEESQNVSSALMAVGDFITVSNNDSDRRWFNPFQNQPVNESPTEVVYARAILRKVGSLPLEATGIYFGSFATGTGVMAYAHQSIQNNPATDEMEPIISVFLDDDILSANVGEQGSVFVDDGDAEFLLELRYNFSTGHAQAFVNGELAIEETFDPKPFDEFPSIVELPGIMWMSGQFAAEVSGLSVALSGDEIVEPLEAGTLFVFNETDTTVDVRYNDVSGGTEPMTHTLQRSDGAGGWIDEFTLTAGTTASPEDPETVTGLTAGTAYTFRVKTVDADSNEVFSNEETVSTTGGVALEAGTLSVVSKTDTTVTLEYSSPSGGTPPYENIIDREGQFGWGMFPEGPIADGGQATVEDLTPDTAYNFRIDTTDDASNEVTSNEVAVTTDP